MNIIQSFRSLLHPYIILQHIQLPKFTLKLCMGVQNYYMAAQGCCTAAKLFSMVVQRGLCTAVLQFGMATLALCHFSLKPHGHAKMAHSRTCFYIFLLQDLHGHAKKAHGRARGPLFITNLCTNMFKHYVAMSNYPYNIQKITTRFLSI